MILGTPLSIWVPKEKKRYGHVFCNKFRMAALGIAGTPKKELAGLSLFQAEWALAIGALQFATDVCAEGIISALRVFRRFGGRLINRFIHFEETIKRLSKMTAFKTNDWSKSSWNGHPF